MRNRTACNRPGTPPIAAGRWAFLGRAARRMLATALLSVAVAGPSTTLAVATYEPSSEALKIPFLEAPGLGKFAVTLTLQPPHFVLTGFEQLPSSAFDDNPAVYRDDTGVMDIPLVYVPFGDGSTVPFSVVLTRDPSAQGFRFTVTDVEEVSGDGDPVSLSLTRLNVDTVGSPRVDADGEPLPADFSPLGASADIDVTREIFLLGIKPDGGDNAAAFVDVQPQGASVPPAFSSNLLNAPAAGATPWADDSLGQRALARAGRTAVGADIDGDGFEETVAVYTAVEDGNDLLRVEVIEDQAAGFASRGPQTVAFGASAEDVNAVGADVDGDGADELVVTLVQAGGVRVWVLEWDASTLDWTLETSKGTMLARSLDSGAYTSLDAGSSDYDRAEEVVVVVTEIVDSDNGLARYHVLDAAADGGLEVIASDVVSGQTDVGLRREAIVADVSMGDIDGDGLDELVFAGLENISGGGGCKSYGHVLQALDDVHAGLDELGTEYFSHFFRNCPSFSAWRLRYVHINTPDLDGDGRHEIQANQFFYDDFVAGTFAPLDGVAIPEPDMFEVGDYGWFDRSTSTIEAADVTNDGRDNIVYYAQNYNNVHVWGIDELGDWSRMVSIPVAFANAQSARQPRIVPVNVDADGPVLKYEEGDYELVFTEPMIIAALAAPPCIRGVGQNTEQCVSSYGTAKTVSIGAEASATVSAGIHAGFKGEVKVFGVGAELERTRSFTATATAGLLAAYELTKEVRFNSGPLTDSVVFTTIPYDRYTYRVASHPNPDLVGEELVISIPREPITLMADRDFYNGTVEQGGVLIDERVFRHSVGKPETYPTAAQKNAFLDNWYEQYRSEIESLGSVGRGVLDALKSLSLESDTQSVDQGGGFREVTLITNEAFGVGVGSSIETEVEVTGTAGGKMLGYTKGVSAQSSLQVTKGDSTIYGGSVGALPADSFADNQYNYGLFVYTHEDRASGQEFEVINYWVER